MPRFTKEQLKEAGITIKDDGAEVVINNQKDFIEKIKDGTIIISKNPVELTGKSPLATMLGRVHKSLINSIDGSLDADDKALFGEFADIDIPNGSYFLTVEALRSEFEKFKSKDKTDRKPDPVDPPADPKPDPVDPPADSKGGTKPKRYYRIVDNSSSFQQLWDKFHEKDKAILVLYGKAFKMEDYKGKTFDDFKNDIDSARSEWNDPDKMTPQERLAKKAEVDAKVDELILASKKPEKPEKAPAKGPEAEKTDPKAEEGEKDPKPEEGKKEPKPAKPKEEPKKPAPGSTAAPIKGVSPEKSKEVAGRKYTAVGKITLLEKDVYNYMLKLMAIAEKDPKLLHLTAEVNDSILTGRASYTDVIDKLNKGMLEYYEKNPDIDSKAYYDAVREFNNATVRNEASRPVDEKDVEVDAPEGRKNLYERVVRKNNAVNDDLRKTLQARKIMKEKDGILVPAKTKSADYASIADSMYSELTSSCGEELPERIRVAMEYQRLNDVINATKKDYQLKKDKLESGAFTNEQVIAVLENQVEQAYQRFQVACMEFMQFCDKPYENGSVVESHTNAYIAASTLGQIQAITIAESLAGRSVKDMYFGKPVLDNEPTRVSNYRAYIKLNRAVWDAEQELQDAKVDLDKANVTGAVDVINAKKAIVEQKKQELKEANENLKTLLKSKSKIESSLLGAKSMKAELRSTEDAILSCELGSMCDISSDEIEGPRVDLALYSASRRMLLASLSEEEVGGIKDAAKKIRQKESKERED